MWNVAQSGLVAALREIVETEVRDAFDRVIWDASSEVSRISLGSNR
jgi:hypothetical protein